MTAEHVAARMECCPILLGFRYRSGSRALLQADNVDWYSHPTETGAVYAAVTPFAPLQLDLLDLEPIPEHLFTSAGRTGKASYGVGDEIAAIGVFTRFSYIEDPHLPIVRTGTLAMLPTLPISVKNFEPMEAYIAEIEGLSGSPIWMRPTALNAAQKNEDGEKPSVPFDGDTDMVLLGLLHGRWEIPKEAMQGQSAHYTENMISGMSIIVPVHKIPEVINQPELAGMRKKNDENIAKKSNSAGS